MAHKVQQAIEEQRAGRGRDGPIRRRLVRFGESFGQEELDSGEVELEEVPPADEPPEDEQTEPWGWRDKEAPGRVRERLRAYREFLRERGEGTEEDEAGEDDYGSGESGPIQPLEPQRPTGPVDLSGQSREGDEEDEDGD